MQKVAGLGDALTELDASAARLSRAFANSAGGSSVVPSFLQSPYIPLGLIGCAVLFILVLMALNSKSSSFEQMAIEQADQNDRNQQAILRLLDEMGSLADGDLTVEATVTEDITGTIADSFNYAIEELRKLVATVNETSIMVDSAAKQTENTASHMAKAADNQAREINAATESVVSMAASIEEVSGNAERSSDVARHSVEVAHKGGEAVRRTIDGMNAIRETIQDTSKRIKRLGESSQEIGNIVELINDIAEQTNILALNASIQASMAGEAGRGFAVVADEVQRLAERSTNATKQIEVLVRTIQADTNEAVVSMERSTTDVVGGALLAENAGAALDEIEQVSNQIASLVQNISGSARQQAGSAADVTRRTTRLREISEQTGKATTATAAAISKLSELASQLRKTVAGFTLPNKSLQASTLVSDLCEHSAERPAGEQAKQASGEPLTTRIVDDRRHRHTRTGSEETGAVQRQRAGDCQYRAHGDHSQCAPRARGLRRRAWWVRGAGSRGRVAAPGPRCPADNRNLWRRTARGGNGAVLQVPGQLRAGKGREDGLDALTRAMVQLPIYIERLLAGVAISRWCCCRCSMICARHAASRCCLKARCCC